MITNLESLDINNLVGKEFITCISSGIKCVGRSNVRCSVYVVNTFEINGDHHTSFQVIGLGSDAEYPNLVDAHTDFIERLHG